ncbi:deoxyribose-phosphate aldolase [Legionella lansingensis]|uniref:Deoxyribose-phosphate aldolase n=1 Tax=Legionella lansingensis TaxID=45067 RepID=A0A0W0VL17_9GAMM|nr:deoxyribose-phosphate aldolase [Legionella lansingensis]KTD20807.1 2-deoxyribose-5-phosphate aldolase [Legionella lansingensis]SNV49845.1 deoxyribose-phosphate aldolase [Legionella lansingensis]
MTLESQFLAALGSMNEAAWDTVELKSKAISLIDLTLLNEAATAQTIQSLKHKARTHHVAAICVLPQHIQLLAPAEPIKVATVVNFPTGNATTREVLSEIDEITANTIIDEIDYVFPYQSYLAGKQAFALSQCQQVYSHCKKHELTFKVILETGALPNLDCIYQLSSEVIMNGCDFLKTSTGKISKGASPAAAFAMLKAIHDSKRPCGFKVSGGIRQPAQACTYICLAKQMLHRELDPSWFRIGASSLLDALVDKFGTIH